MSDPNPWAEELSSLIRDRAAQGWGELQLHRRGEGFDITVRVDGTYFDEETAKEMLAYYQTELRRYRLGTSEQAVIGKNRRTL